MSKSIATTLYNISRKLSKVATTINDIKTISTGDPSKIAKRYAKKKVNKASNKIARNINKHLK